MAGSHLRPAGRRAEALKLLGVLGQDAKRAATMSVMRESRCDEGISDFDRE